MYMLLKNPITNEVDTVRRTADGACIPFAPDNTDYQQYLAWLDEGNQPLPPDEAE